jgi:hypothetical protein
MNAQDIAHIVLFWPQYMTPYAGQNARSLAAALALAEAALAVWIARSRNNLWLAPREGPGPFPIDRRIKYFRRRTAPANSS